MCPKDYHYTGYNNDLIRNANTLRKTMTPQERRLWYEFLRGYPYKFYRQRPIDHYIADFYCSEAKLVIEIDGGQHFTDEGKQYDDHRSDVLRQHGLEILRFTNIDIAKRFPSVCEVIDQAVKNRVGK